MRTKTLETILSNYFPDTAFLERPSSSPQGREAWKEEFDKRLEWGSEIEDLADDYLSNNLSFRNPVLESRDEGSGSYLIADGISRVLAVKLLVDRGQIEAHQALISVAYLVESKDDGYLFFGKSLGLDKNVFASPREGSDSFFTISISATSPEDGIAPTHAIFDADNGFFDKLSTFKVNNYAWAKALTGGFDSKENTGDFLLQLDFNAAECDDEFLLTTYADITRRLESFAKSTEDDFGVTVSVDFMEAEGTWGNS